MLGPFCLQLNTFVLDPEAQMVKKNANFNEAVPVSYTHLTLPTSVYV